MRAFSLTAAFAVLLAAPAEAATVSGVITDSTGSAVPDAQVALRNVATGEEQQATTGGDGRYRFEVDTGGTYLVIVTRAGFSEAARTVRLEATDSVNVPVTLELGSFTADVTVTAARSERELRQVPLHVDTIPAAAVEQRNTLSTGDALAPARGSSSRSRISPTGSTASTVSSRCRGAAASRSASHSAPCRITSPNSQTPNAQVGSWKLVIGS